MRHSENINEVAVALAAVQANLCPAKKDSTNPHFRSKYADLTSVWDAIREPLAAQGLAVVQGCSVAEQDRAVIISTMLIHKSGQWISSEVSMPLVKSDPQAVGSAITYGRRYSLSAMVGVTADDDDAESAMQRNGNGGHAGGNRPTPARKSQPETPKPAAKPAPKAEPKADANGNGGAPRTYGPGDAKLLDRLKSAATDVALPLGSDDKAIADALRGWWKDSAGAIAELSEAEHKELTGWCKAGAQP